MLNYFIENCGWYLFWFAILQIALFVIDKVYRLINKIDKNEPLLFLNMIRIFTVAMSSPILFIYSLECNSVLGVVFSFLLPMWSVLAAYIDGVFIGEEG